MPVTFSQAVEVFARGFAFTRSFTHPYIAEQVVEGVWALRDAQRKRGNYRSEEYVAHGIEPARFDAIARQHTRGQYRLCAIRTMEESDDVLRCEFKAMGYRLLTTEAFMVQDLKCIPKAPAPVSIECVTSPLQAEALAKVAGRRQILPEFLTMTPEPMRQYVAQDGDSIVGWVGSVVTIGCAWCTNMYVAPEYRRRGIARALMTRMLQDDRCAGAQANVLLASHTGARLYPLVGYQQIGELLMFVPQRSK
jgi:GNAT superfamily N-acetyltransferase